ncbi:MAG TPA: cache domain-containing protein [Pseudolabrys sp.]|nr:cache domain-containing protein [Pseudolabrys sp.]
MLRPEFGPLIAHRAEEAVLQSIAAAEDFFIPAETALDTDRLLLADHVLGLDKPDQLERYFINQLRAQPRVQGLYVGTPAGDFFYVMRSNEKAEGGTRTKVIRSAAQGREVALTWRGPDGAAIKNEPDPADTYDPRTRGWYRSAVEKRGRVWTEPYIFFTARKPGITLAAPIVGKDGAVEAVLGVDIEMDAISRLLAQTSLLNEKTVYISTADGKVIAHSGASVVMPDSAAGRDALRFRDISELPGAEGKLVDRVREQLSKPAAPRATAVWEAQADGRHYFVAVGKMSSINWPWQLVVMVPRTRQLEVGAESNLFLIGALAFSTLFSLAVAYATSRAVGAPLGQLLANARLARNGNVELMDDLNTGSEEIDETDKILKELAAVRRETGSSAMAHAGERSET